MESEVAGHTIGLAPEDTKSRNSREHWREEKLLEQHKQNQNSDPTSDTNHETNSERERGCNLRYTNGHAQPRNQSTEEGINPREQNISTEEAPFNHELKNSKKQQKSEELSHNEQHSEQPYKNRLAKNESPNLGAGFNISTKHLQQLQEQHELSSDNLYEEKECLDKPKRRTHDETSTNRQHRKGKQLLSRSEKELFCHTRSPSENTKRKEKMHSQGNGTALAVIHKPLLNQLLFPVDTNGIKMISWNCRGLAGKAFLITVRSYIATYQPEIIFLLETHVEEERAETILGRTHYSVNIVIPFEGHSGGIIMMWNAQRLDIQLMDCSTRAIHVTIKDRREDKMALVSIVYQHPRHISNNREFLPAGLVEEIISISIPHPSNIDTLSWGPSMDGVVNIRNVYNTLRNEKFPHIGPELSWLTIWKAKILPRVKTFLWLMVQGKLPVAKLLYDRRKIPSNICNLCSSEEESIEHFLARCEGALPAKVNMAQSGCLHRKAVNSMGRNLPAGHTRRNITQDCFNLGSRSRTSG
ncbi:hypothetical protein ACH5RR_033636 [Cinchona calisaya]|uniref:Reverse transcriptase zinc-binding domain-containing protein n=1 Tax=Cinchona calisaya TaxID=153742 RepID=A0ABD2Y9J4_9GENT